MRNWRSPTNSWLCRKLWTTNVTQKAARRYLGPLLRVGVPVATHDELERYLHTCADSPRVRRANFPIAAACMPEEFADWLKRSRRVPLVRPARVAMKPAETSALPDALTVGELGDRAKEFCVRLGSHQTQRNRGLANQS